MTLFWCHERDPLAGSKIGHLYHDMVLLQFDRGSRLSLALERIDRDASVSSVTGIDIKYISLTSLTFLAEHDHWVFLHREEFLS